MSTPANLDCAAYLVICDWGDVLEARDRVRILAAAAGLDPQVTLTRAGRGAPLVISRLDPEVAPAVIDSLREHGVTANAPTGYCLRALSDPLTIKGMDGERAGWKLTFRESPITATLRPESLRLIIRAELGTRRGGTRSTTKPGQLSDTATIAIDLAAEIATDLLLDVPHASTRLPGSLDLDPATAAPSPKLTAKTRHIIDLWTNDAQRFRIDADRFAWQVLGNDRGHSDRANAAAMIDMLSDAAPNAIIDGGFERFSIADPAAEKLFSRPAPGGKPDPAFEFYSRWAWVFYAEG